MIKPDSTLVMNNVDVNELYLVQISGLWGTWSLLNTHRSSSYIEKMLTEADAAAD